VEAERLVFRKDALLAEFSAELARWHAVQGVALGSVGLGILGFFEGSVGRDSILGVVLIAAASIGVAGRILAQHRTRFYRELADLLSSLARLKPPEAP